MPQQAKITIPQHFSGGASRLIFNYISNHIFRKVVLHDHYIPNNRFFTKRKVSSIDVKSTCSNSPGPLQARGLKGATGGVASNFLHRLHFLMQFLSSRAIPGHQNHSCMRDRELL